MFNKEQPQSGTIFTHLSSFVELNYNN